MTSHLYLNKSFRPLTVSKKSLETLIDNKSLNLVRKKIIITDDISNMASINSYKEKSKLKNSKLVLNAFEAGHDVILISHLEQHSENNFTVNDVRESIEELDNYSKTEQGLKRIKMSLEKVLTLKSLVSKKPEHELAGKDIDEIYSRFVEVLKNGTLKISESADKSDLNFIDDIEPTKKIFVVGEDKFFPEMKKVLNEDGLIEYKKLSSFENRWSKPRKQISKMGARISDLVRDGNYLVFLVSNADTFNILDSLRFNNIESSRVLISVHGSTMQLKTDALLYFRVITNFDDSPYSTHPLALILKGIIEPGDLYNSPIAIGTGGIFKLDDRNPIEYSHEDGALAKEFSEKNNKMSTTSIIVYITIITALITATFLALSIFSCHAKNCNDVSSRKDFWKGALVSKSYYKRKCLITLLIICSISVPILAANPGEFSAIVAVSEYQIQTTMIKELLSFLIWLDMKLVILTSFFQ